MISRLFTSKYEYLVNVFHFNKAKNSEIQITKTNEYVDLGQLVEFLKKKKSGYASVRH